MVVLNVTDRVVQAALKLMLEPIFEADFKSCSSLAPSGGGREIETGVQDLDPAQ